MSDGSLCPDLHERSPHRSLCRHQTIASSCDTCIAEAECKRLEGVLAELRRQNEEAVKDAQDWHTYYDSANKARREAEDRLVLLRADLAQMKADVARLSALVPQWKDIAGARPGQHLLYFPADHRLMLAEMIRVDYHPVSYPRKPTHFIPLPPAPPKADA